MFRPWAARKDRTTLGRPVSHRLGTVNPSDYLADGVTLDSLIVFKFRGLNTISTPHRIGVLRRDEHWTSVGLIAVGDPARDGH